MRAVVSTDIVITANEADEHLSITGSNYVLPEMIAQLPYSMNPLSVSDYRVPYLGKGFSCLIAWEVLVIDTLENIFGINMPDAEIDVYWDK